MDILSRGISGISATREAGLPSAIVPPATVRSIVGPRSSWAGFLRDNIVRQPLIWLVALLVGIVHAATAGRYDAQRNELYFLACGWHPDFGYVDQPPLVPLIAAATQVFGIS